MPDLAQIKADSRRRIHGRAAVPVSYFPDGDVTEPAVAGITARWHNKIDTTGDLDGSYGSVIEGIDRLVFSLSNVAAVNAERADQDPALPPIAIQRGAAVRFDQYQGALFVLDSREPTDGPETVAWVVVRQRD